MTLQELKNINKGCVPQPTSLNFTVGANRFTPHEVNLFNEGVPTPPTDNDFNHVPLTDMRAMREFRYMDPIHKADKMASELDKGIKLNAIAKVQGKKKFAQNYNVTLDD